MTGGILNIYKPVGLTSRQVVEKVGTLLKSKVGHAGTLDPFARGVLLVCWGKATRFTMFFQHLPKVYRAKIRFGINTDTYDASGRITECTRRKLRKEELLQVIHEYKGTVIQKIPIFSAHKYKGKSCYYYARNGITIPELTKQVQIYSAELLQCEEGQFGEAEILIECSSGTYIRSFAFELGCQLGLGAYLFSLCRERIGKFTFQESLDIFKDYVDPTMWFEKSLSVDEGLYWIPSWTANEEEARRFQQGGIIKNTSLNQERWLKVYWREKFLGLGEVRNASCLQPRIVLSE
ncbi:MAG: tRNA pseudouridine(55) synthase TruB [Candidatus Caldatribacteriaceae bacterium]